MMELEESIICREFLRLYLPSLTPREEVVFAEWLQGSTYTDVGRGLDITSGRVSQIARKAINKIRRFWKEYESGDLSSVRRPEKPEPKPKISEHAPTYTPRLDPWVVHVTATKQSSPREAWRIVLDFKTQLTYWENSVTKEVAWYGGEAEPPL